MTEYHCSWVPSNAGVQHFIYGLYCTKSVHFMKISFLEERRKLIIIPPDNTEFIVISSLLILFSCTLFADLACFHPSLNPAVPLWRWWTHVTHSLPITCSLELFHGTVPVFYLSLQTSCYWMSELFRAKAIWGRIMSTIYMAESLSWPVLSWPHFNAEKS